MPVFKVGGDNFPEAITKMFLINAPFSFRAGW
jgi:hypothetical protein